jgi:hypothetical protein
MSENPELEGYEPTGGGIRSRARRRATRIVVFAAIAALILPGILITVGFAQRTADSACAYWVAVTAVNADRSLARFELFGRGGPGWQCYAVSEGGAERHIAPIGIIPTMPRQVPVELS